MSWRRPPVARLRSRPARKAELLADLDRKQRDAAGVLLGRAVLLGEGHEQGADVGAEERLFRGDEVGATKITRSGPDRCAALRRRSSATGIPTAAIPAISSRVPEPPAEDRGSRSISAPTSAAPSHTMPTATARSRGGE